MPQGYVSLLGLSQTMREVDQQYPVSGHQQMLLLTRMLYVPLYGPRLDMGFHLQVRCEAGRPHQRLVMVQVGPSGFDAGLDLETLRGLLYTYQGLIAVLC